MTSPLVCFMRLIVLIFFFFNHQTAYEMRISDWSSDVCTSDLAGLGTVPVAVAGSAPVAGSEVLFQNTVLPARAKPTMVSSEVTRMTVQTTTIDADSRALSSTISRTEANTSELQSLMRNSYDVLCLKKITSTTITYDKTKMFET